MKRSEYAKLESYREQRDFEKSSDGSIFDRFMTSFLHSSNELHIKKLELADSHPGSVLDAQPGIAHHSDDESVQDIASSLDI